MIKQEITHLIQNINRSKKLKIDIKRRNHAVSPAISNVIMAGAIIIVGFAVFSWSNGVSTTFNTQYSSSIDSNLDKIGEKLVFEHIFYEQAHSKLYLYILNCGESTNVEIASIKVSNSSWNQVFSIITINFLNGTTAHSLNTNNEAFLTLNASLQNHQNYFVNLTTNRGRTFGANFSI